MINRKLLKFSIAINSWIESKWKTLKNFRRNPFSAFFSDCKLSYISGKNKKPRSDDRDFLVAGAGFEPTTFGL